MRGEYASVNTAIIDDHEFKALSPSAKACWYTLRMLLGASGIDLVRGSIFVLRDLTGLDEGALRSALQQLVDNDWLVAEGDIMWLRNALKFNPAMSTKNEKHVTGISKHLAGLPRARIVNIFAAYYGIPEPFPGVGTDSHSIPYGIQDNGQRTTDNGQEDNGHKNIGPPADLDESGSGGDQPRSDVEIPTYTESKLLEEANTVLGLKVLDRDGQRANRGILKHWLYKRPPIPSEEVYAAIHGLRWMVDNGRPEVVDWLSPKKPISLRALNNTETLFDQGDGKAKRVLFDVAVELYQRHGDETTSRGGGTKSVSEIIAAASRGAA